MSKKIDKILNKNKKENIGLNSFYYTPHVTTMVRCYLLNKKI